MKDRKDHSRQMAAALSEGGEIYNNYVRSKHPNPCDYCLAMGMLIAMTINFQAKFGRDEMIIALQKLAEELPEDADLAADIEAEAEAEENADDPIGETQGSA